MCYCVEPGAVLHTFQNCRTTSFHNWLLNEMRNTSISPANYELFGMACGKDNNNNNGEALSSRNTQKKNFLSPQRVSNP